MQEIWSEIRYFITAPDAKPNAFDSLARRLFAFQFENNPAYRAYCKARGVIPDSITTASDIPAIVSSAFKDFDLTVLSPTDRTTIFHSSGTTQHRPSRHFHSAQTLNVYEESLVRWFTPHVCPGPGRFNFLIFSPRAATAPHSSLVHMFESVSAKLGELTEFCAQIAPDGGWEIDFDLIFRAHQSLSANNLPVVICGTAFSFVHLCDALESRGMDLHFPPQSRVFETGGYKGRSRAVTKSELHAMISRRLLVPETHIISEYGMSELSSQAYDRAAGNSGERIFQFPPWARATLLSPETGKQVSDGEVGLVRIVDLANVGSVLSIQTEDLALRRGDGFELVGRATEAEARGCSLMQVAG